jgi:hypothetical protein
LISELSVGRFNEVVYHKLNLLDQLKANSLLHKYHKEIDEAVLYYKEICQTNNKIISHLHQLVDTITKDMQACGQQIDREYGQSFGFESKFARVGTYSIRIPPEIKAKIKVKIISASSHIYPGLILGCKFKEWIDCLVASDPLYLTNFNDTSLHELITEYPIEYQRRLRLYKIKDSDYRLLPQEQASIIVSWDYFPYITQQNFNLCLTAAYNLLRPGGTFIFDYNNYYLTATAKNIEQGIIAYHSHDQLIKICIELGFQIISDNQYESDTPEYDDVCWLILQKPGNLSTTKLKQVLGQILTK